MKKLANICGIVILIVLLAGCAKEAKQASVQTSDAGANSDQSAKTTIAPDAPSQQTNQQAESQPMQETSGQQTSQQTAEDYNNLQSSQDTFKAIDDGMQYY